VADLFELVLQSDVDVFEGDNFLLAGGQIVLVSFLSPEEGFDLIDEVVVVFLQIGVFSQEGELYFIAELFGEGLAGKGGDECLFAEVGLQLFGFGLVFDGVGGMLISMLVGGGAEIGVGGETSPHLLCPLIIDLFFG
jgi:hypothetical protein